LLLVAAVVEEATQAQTTLVVEVAVLVVSGRGQLLLL
jgi:hypothetical protein